jgi:hypothetical protein
MNFREKEKLSEENSLLVSERVSEKNIPSFGIIG